MKYRLDQRHGVVRVTTYRDGHLPVVSFGKEQVQTRGAFAERRPTYRPEVVLDAFQANVEARSTTNKPGKEV